MASAHRTNRESLAYWTEILCGTEPERVLAAFAELESWGLERVLAATDHDSIDAAVTAMLLVEGVDRLVSAGVTHASLLKKLRHGDFWPTWAEIRVADILVGVTEEPLRVELEPGRAQGAHADWRFVYPDDSDGISIEVKAVGLSDEEAAFCQRMAPSLTRMLPEVGLGHVHASIHAASPRPTRDQRRAGHREARMGTRKVPNFPRGLRAAVIVGHDTEESYRRRIANRVIDAVRQLPTDDECWIALYWSNGAPVSDAAAAVDWSRIPAHVRGLLFVGQGVWFPHRNIHCFASAVERDAAANDFKIVSAEGDAMTELATRVLADFERSSGVRATLLRVGNRTLVYRDGSQGLYPFNLLLDADPEIPPGFEVHGRQN